MSWLRPNEGNPEIDPSVSVPSMSPTGSPFIDNVIGSFQSQQNNNPFSYANAVRDEWGKSLTLLAGQSGAPSLGQISSPDIDNGLHAVTGTSIPWYSSAYGLDGVSDPNPQMTQKIVQANNYIKALKNSKIKSLEEVVAKVKADRQLSIQNENIARNEGGLDSTVGGFIGGFAGYVDNPINFATLGFGGFGKVAAMRIASEAGIIGGVNAINTAAFTNPQHTQAGEDSDSVGSAFLQGAEFGGFARGIGEAAHGILGRLLPREVEKPTINPQVDAVENIAKSLPENPQARAVNYAIDLRKAFDEAKPYPDGQNGDLQFIADMNEMTKNFPKTETAIGNFGVPSPGPINAKAILDVSPEELATIESRPDLLQSLKTDYVGAKDLRANINNLDDVNNTRLSHILRDVNPEDAAIARKAEGTLGPASDQGLEPSGSKELRAVKILAGLKKKYLPDSITGEELNGTDLSMTRDEAAGLLQQGIDIKQKNINETWGQIQDFKKQYGQEQIARRWLDAIRAQDAAGKVDDVNGSMLKIDPNVPARDALEVSKKVVSDLPDAMDRKLDDALASEGNTIDLGNGRKLPADLMIPNMDSRGNIKMVRAADVLKDLENDRALVEAVGSCSI